MAEGSISHEEIRRRSAPWIASLLAAFSYEHLPPELQAVSKPFCDLAYLHAAAMGAADGGTPTGIHLAQGLYRLLEAKDCIVRAAFFY